MARGYLVLEDGTAYEGELFGSEVESFGEVVFETGMDGYQESLTDPSFRGHILVMTYPIVGNYGIRDEFNQSDDVHVRGLVVREHCTCPSPMYGGGTLDGFLKEHGIPAISGIDTRELVIRIRTQGTVKGAIVPATADLESVVAMISRTPSPLEENLVAEVSCKSPYHIDNGKDVTVGLLDFGTKRAIVDELSKRANVTVFPYNTPADVISESKVAGLLVSNGPGDPAIPAIVSTGQRTVEVLSSEMPLFGICYGSQIIARAFGAETYKMKFGHRGSNQPVKYGGRVYVTSQNHGFAVDDHSLEGTGLIADQININDSSVEGVVHGDLPIFTTQYHPEANPGPDDTAFMFDKFIKMARRC